MDNNWASDNLQTIRTLMERTAVYRRALAPIMIVIGLIGLGGLVFCLFGQQVHKLLVVDSNRRFVMFWMGLSALALVASYFLVRLQALKDKEPFWSPPTRRVTQALLPPFFVGLVIGAIFLVRGDEMPQVPWYLVLVWTLFYGCAIHAAGFFMPRGIKLLGWLFVLAGCALFIITIVRPQVQTSYQAANATMGALFGALHLLYGVYLFVTGKGRSQAAA